MFLAIVALFAVPVAQASDKSDSEILIDKATATVKGFAADESLKWFSKNAQAAKAILVIPQSIKGAFLVGGAGGTGVLVSREGDTGAWGQPAFYTLGSLSVGIQIGAESSEVILLVMTERGMESLLASSFKLGADVSVAVGPEGAGVKAKTADILSYSKSKGAFVGASLDGAVIKTRDKLNEAYYGKAVSPTDILIRKNVSNPHSDALRAAVAAMTGM